MIITLTLNPSIDYILQVPQIHMEDTLRAKYAFFQAGGKGINVSRVLKRLDMDTQAWGFCGGDTGRWLEAFLDEEQVPHAFVRTRGETRVNPIITELESKAQLRISAAGQAVSHQECESLFAQLDNHEARQTCYMALGGSLPPGMPPETMKSLAALAQAKGIPCILDADGETLKQGLKASPYMIKPNQYELERLLGIPVTDASSVIQGARQIMQDYQVTVVVTSLAQAGAILITKDEVHQAKAPRVDVQSKVGAGDSMVAGLLKGMMEKRSWPEVLRMGIAAGTAAVMTPGSELCLRHDYESLLPQVQVTQPV